MKKEKYYKVYQAWSDMKQKCDNPKAKTYKTFGGRGIGYEPAWCDYNSFRHDMIHSYLELVEKGVESRKITLGRINRDGDFSAANCKWLTPIENNMIISAERYNFVVAKGSDGIKRVFPNLKELSSFYGVARTGASNALHQGRNYVKDIVFTKITPEQYYKALEDNKFLNSLEITYDEAKFKREQERTRKILQNKLSNHS